MADADKFDVRLVNNTLEQAFRDLEALVEPNLA